MTKKQIAKTITEISIYPSPSNGNFTVVIANEVKQSHSIEILDAQGKIVFEKLSNEKTIQINLSNNLPGIYLVKIQIGNTVITKKIIYQ